MCCWNFADSQITYRQRYVMIAALAPVIDLVMLDPNNPRSVDFQLDRIETHLGALPRRNATGRLSSVQQIVASIATRLRTVDAAKIDEALILDVEQSLDETVGCDHRDLSHAQRTIGSRPVGSTRMIYDIRQTTICSYASPVAHARHVLRSDPVDRHGQHVHIASLQIVPEPSQRREGQDFFGNRITWIDARRSARHADREIVSARRGGRDRRARGTHDAGLGGGARRGVRDR